MWNSLSMAGRELLDSGVEDGAREREKERWRRSARRAMAAEAAAATAGWGDFHAIGLVGLLHGKAQDQLLVLFAAAEKRVHRTTVITLRTFRKSICTYAEETILEHLLKKALTLHNFGIWYPNVG